MKKASACVAILCAFLLLIGCGKKEAYVTETIEGNCNYCKMSDGTWKCNDLSYKYRLEISGRMPNAVRDSTFVYLSNLEEIPFERAWQASGLSSSLSAYFSREEAVLVEVT